MKMSSQDYDAMKEKIRATVTAWPMRLSVYADRYRETGKSDQRFRWDVLYASKVDVCSVYHYLDDRHIDTALKRIIQEII